jgi:hypothetical protein
MARFANFDVEKRWAGGEQLGENPFYKSNPIHGVTDDEYTTYGIKKKDPRFFGDFGTKT